MLKALLAGAAATVAIAATPALAQTTITPPSSPMSTQVAPMGTPAAPPIQALPSEPVSPAERAQVRRDWNDMAREWERRQRGGTAPPQGSIGAPSMPMGSPPVAGPSTFGGVDSDTRIAPSQPLPPRGSGLQGLPQEPVSPAERAQVRRDWNEMAREWEQRQRGGFAPPADTGQPPLPYQR